MAEDKVLKFVSNELIEKVIPQITEVLHSSGIRDMGEGAAILIVYLCGMEHSETGEQFPLEYLQYNLNLIYKVNRE